MAVRERLLPSWQQKEGGIIGPDERLPWLQEIVLGIQHVFAMFGATVVAPLLMGFNPNLALLFSGVATLIFFAVTLGRLPSYLGSSFAFIAPVLAVVSGHGTIAQALGGIVVAGAVYAVIGLIVQLSGWSWIDFVMPPLVTGTIVMIIGLNLAVSARNLAAQDPAAALITILAIFLIALFTRGLFARLPILLGVIVGYVAVLILGGTSVAGRSFGFFKVPGIDLSPISKAAWFGAPHFITPSFTGRAISLIVPVVIVLVAENTGHIKAVSVITDRDLMPYLGRGFLGDGIGTAVSGFFGGPGMTTYAENIGVMAVTRVYSTLLFVIAAVVAILLGLSPKFGALLSSIPSGVLGGASTVLFGLIAATGARIWIQDRIDFSRAGNLFVVAVGLILGAGDYTLTFGNFAMGGLTVGTFAVIILYQLVKLAPQEMGIDIDAETPGVTADVSGPAHAEPVRPPGGWQVHRPSGTEPPDGAA